MPNLKGRKEVRLSYVAPRKAADTSMINLGDHRNLTKAAKNRKPSRTHEDYHLILEVHRPHLTLIFLAPGQGTQCRLHRTGESKWTVNL